MLVDYDRRTYDIILFGATSFHGKYIAKYLHQLNRRIKWAIAGRTKAKLSLLMNELRELNVEGSTYPDLLIIDATDYRGIVDAFTEARIVLNCTGPYHILGNDIVRACMNTRSNYIDLCTDSYFIETIFNEYHDVALLRGIVILHSCTYDAVSSDLGLLYNMIQFPPTRCCSIDSFLILNNENNGNITRKDVKNNSASSKELKLLRMETEKKYKPPQVVHPDASSSSSSSSNAILSAPTASNSGYFEPRVQRYAVRSLKGTDISLQSQRAVALKMGNPLVWPRYNPYVTTDNYYNATSTAYSSALSKMTTALLSGLSKKKETSHTVPAISSDSSNDDGSTTNSASISSGSSGKSIVDTSYAMYFYGVGYSSSSSNDVMSVGEEEEMNSRRKTDKMRPRIRADELSTTSLGGASCSIYGAFMNKRNSSATSADVGNSNRANYTDAAAGCKKDSTSNSSGNSSAKDEANVIIKTIISGPDPETIATPSIFVTLALILLDDRQSVCTGGVLTPLSAFYECTTIFDKLIAAGILFIVDSIDMNQGWDYYYNDDIDANANAVVATTTTISSSNSGDKGDICTDTDNTYSDATSSTVIFSYDSTTS